MDKRISDKNGSIPPTFSCFTFCCLLVFTLFLFMLIEFILSMKYLLKYLSYIFLKIINTSLDSGSRPMHDRNRPDQSSNTFLFYMTVTQHHSGINFVWCYTLRHLKLSRVHLQAFFCLSWGKIFISEKSVTRMTCRHIISPIRVKFWMTHWHVAGPL